MGLISTLVPDVRVEIPEIVGFVAERQLLRSLREFAEKTRAWRENLTITTVAGDATIDLTTLLPAFTELVDVISIRNIGGSAPPIPRTFIWLDKNVSDWRSSTALDAKWFVLDGNNTVRLVPTPSAEVIDHYTMRLALKPMIGATAIDDVILNKYDEVLIHGALSKLFAMPRKPWTDASLAGFHLSLFMAAIPGARTAAAEEFQTGIPRKVKYGGI